MTIAQIWQVVTSYSYTLFIVAISFSKLIEKLLNYDQFSYCLLIISVAKNKMEITKKKNMNWVYDEKIIIILDYFIQTSVEEYWEWNGPIRFLYRHAPTFDFIQSHNTRSFWCVSMSVIRFK